MLHAALSATGLLVAAGAAQAQAPVVPAGYSATVFYQDASKGPLTGLAADAQGRLYCLAQSGVVRRLRDIDGDGVADVVLEVWDGTGLTPPVTGALWSPKHLFLSHLGTISRLADTDDDGVLDAKVDIVTGLPNGWHQNNGLFTDGKSIYFGLGSTTDFQPPSNPYSATLMSLDPVKGGLGVVADGLRNVYDGAVHPVTGDILVGDNGPNTVVQVPDPPDEFNLVRGRQHFGHPFNWGVPGSGSFAAPLVLAPPHSSPCGIAFNENVGMSGYRNEAVAAMIGTGQSAVVKLPLIYGTDDVRSWYSPFVTGLTTAIDVLFDEEGALYVAEYATSTIYRIAQVGSTRLVIEGQPSIGKTCEISIRSPERAGAFAYPAASTGLFAVPINLGGPGLDFHLNLLSPLFALSIAKSTTVFDFPQPTVLNGSGTAVIQIHIPDDPELVGLEIYLQTSVWDPLTTVPVDVSPPQPFRILEPF